jgi:hypothetical protein
MIPYFNLDAPLISTNFGEEFLDVSMKRYSDSPNGFTLYFEDIVFTKKA